MEERQDKQRALFEVTGEMLRGNRWKKYTYVVDVPYDGEGKMDDCLAGAWLMMMQVHEQTIPGTPFNILSYHIVNPGTPTGRVQ